MDVSVLAKPGANLPFKVVMDASGVGCGAVLLHNQRSVAFHSFQCTCNLI